MCGQDIRAEACSCHLSIVVVDDASKHSAAFHRTFAVGTLDWYWTALVDALMWSGSFVVVHVLLHYTPQVSLIEDQHPVESLFSCTPEPSLSIRIRFGCSVWSQYDFYAFSLEHPVEGRGELGIPVVDQEAEGLPLFLLFPQRPNDVTCLLGDPFPGWVSCATGEVHTTSAKLNEE